MIRPYISRVLEIVDITTIRRNTHVFLAALNGSVDTVSNTLHVDEFPSLILMFHDIVD